MPASVSHSSMPPKFPDKQRRPGIIHLPQPIPLQSRTHIHNNNNKKDSAPLKPAAPVPGVVAIRHQLRTPSPGPQRRHPLRTPPSSNRASQKRSKRNEVVRPLSPMLTHAESTPAFEFPSRSEKKPKHDSRKPQLISPPPTPAPEARTKKQRPALNLPKFPKVAFLTPPDSPDALKPASDVSGAPRTGLLPAFTLQEKKDALPFADDEDDDDEVILIKSTPPTLTPFRQPTPPSPGLVRDWEALQSSRPDEATLARLKEMFDIHPTKPSSAPSTPAPGERSQPIPVPRPRAHTRNPSMPAYPTSRRLTLAQEVREDVTRLFGLDSSDDVAIDKATEAWRAYSGSAFNDSPEQYVEKPKVTGPRFLGRMF